MDNKNKQNGRSTRYSAYDESLRAYIERNWRGFRDYQASRRYNDKEMEGLDVLSIQDLQDLGISAGEIEYTNRLSECCGARVTELGELCNECGEPA